jgi:hypothetical protein
VILDWVNVTHIGPSKQVMAFRLILNVIKENKLEVQFIIYHLLEFNARNPKVRIELFCQA